MQPFPILEEVTRVIRVETVPPLFGVGVEALLVVGGDGVLALCGVLGFGVEIVGLVCLDVVPSVELEDVVGGEEVA